MGDTLTTTEAARLASVTAETIRELARNKRIDSQKFGQTLMIDRRSLEQYLASDTVTAWRASHGKGASDTK